MRRGGTSLLTAGVLSLLLLATACGGDDDDAAAGKDKDEDARGTSTREAEAKASGASAKEYIAAIATSMNESEGGGFGDVATNECVAEGYVDAIGLDQLHDTVTPEELWRKPDSIPEDFGLEVDDKVLYADMNDCVDVDMLSLGNYTADEAVAQCVKANTTEEVRLSVFVSARNSAAPEPSADAAVKAALAKCPAAAQAAP